MNINHVNGSNSIDPGRLNKLQQNEGAKVSEQSDKNSEKAVSKGDSVTLSSTASNIAKYSKQVEQQNSPNEARVAELKDAISKGEYPTNQSIEGAASAIAAAIL